MPVLPLRVENATPTDALAYYLGPVHWLDALTPPLENHLTQLSAAVRALLDAKASRPARYRPSTSSSASYTAIIAAGYIAIAVACILQRFDAYVPGVDSFVYAALLGVIPVIIGIIALVKNRAFHGLAIVLLGILAPMGLALIDHQREANKMAEWCKQRKLDPLTCPQMYVVCLYICSMQGGDNACRACK
jgi:hypothetical protein